MKKSIAIGIIFLLIGVSVIPSTGMVVEKPNINQVSNNGNILYVGGSGPNNYTKIQDAIDNASDGDTVFVYNDSSPYIGYLIVNKSISLIGEDRDSTVIKEGRELVYITADYINVTGFTIQIGSTGILIHGGRFSNISGNYIKMEVYGIDILSSGSSSCVISRNIIIMKDFWGISLSSGSNNVISDNTIICTHYISEYGGTNGIYVDKQSSNNKFINNTITGCDFVIKSNHNIIMNNTIDNASDGLELNGCGNNIISGNIFSNSVIGLGMGISIKGFSGNNIISGNIIMNNDVGVYIITSHSNKIFNNNFIDNNVNAEFLMFSFLNKWNGNYWDDWIGLEYTIFRFIPYPILGTLGVNRIQWVNFDRRPAKEPYDIGV